MSCMHSKKDMLLSSKVPFSIHGAISDFIAIFVVVVGYFFMLLLKKLVHQKERQLLRVILDQGVSHM